MPKSQFFGSIDNAAVDARLDALEAFDAAVPSTYVAKAVAAKQTIGDGADPNGVTTQDVKLLVTSTRNNPDKAIEQHLVGYSFYSGTPGGGVGTLQGASFEANAFANEANMTTGVLGIEAIGRGNSNGGFTISQVVGFQSTASAAGTAVIPLLIGFSAAGPTSLSGSPTVTDAMSVRVQEPTIGTNRYAMSVVGRSRFKKGTHANALEIANGSNLLQWGSDGSLLTGYASDGTSSRVVLDPGDSATQRVLLAYFGGTIRPLVVTKGGSEVMGINNDGLIKWTAAGNQQTTVGAAGAASALPATPTKYLKVVDSAGTTLVIPAYAAS